MIKNHDVLKKVLWFKKRNKFDIDFFDYLQPQRIVSTHKKYKSGLFYSDKCNRQIQYESQLELNFIQYLENHSKIKFYFEQPTTIQYWRGRRKCNYTPDFGVYLTSGEFILIEVKNLQNMLESKVQTKIEGLMHFCSEKGFGLLLTEGKYTFEHLTKFKLNRKFENALLKALDKNILWKDDFELIKKNYDGTNNELYKIIIRNNLRYKSFPFKLSKENNNELFRQVFVQKMKYEDLIALKFSTLFK